MAGRISVLIVDGSATMRRALSEIMNSDPDLQVIGMAADGQEAVQLSRMHRPDAVAFGLDIDHKPSADALSVLAGELGVAVVMLSSLGQLGADNAMRALELGVVDFVARPCSAGTSYSCCTGQELVDKLKAASRAPVQKSDGKAVSVRVESRSSEIVRQNCETVVVIGTSTGGPRALGRIITELPRDIGAGILIVQHMPVGFTKPLAERLDSLSPMKVVEARDEEPIRNGTAYVAPGGSHMLVTANATIALADGPAVHGVKPSVDITMASAVRVFRCRTVGVILTGMGIDGTKAMAEVKRAGGITIAEDKSTCVVYGMPKSVVDRGYADIVAPLDRIALEIANAVMAINEQVSGGCSTSMIRT